MFEIDTGVDLSHNSIRQHVNILNWPKRDYNDHIGHGTHIAGIILNGVCDNVELISCNYYDDFDENRNFNHSLECFKKAWLLGVDIINYSSSSEYTNIEEYKVLEHLKYNDTILVVAGGNGNLDLSKPWNRAYPAKYKLPNMIIVGNLAYNGAKVKTSNYGLPGMVWEKGEDVLSTLPKKKFGFMGGTSQAAALYTNRWLKRKCQEVNK